MTTGIPLDLRGPMRPGNPHGPLDGLRQARRDLLVRLRGEGLSFGQIARLLGIHPDSARSAYLKAAGEQGAGGDVRRRRTLVTVRAGDKTLGGDQSSPAPLTSLPLDYAERVPAGLWP